MDPLVSWLLGDQDWKEVMAEFGAAQHFHNCCCLNPGCLTWSRVAEVLGVSSPVGWVRLLGIGMGSREALGLLWLQQPVEPTLIHEQGHPSLYSSTLPCSPFLATPSWQDENL